MTFGTTPLEFAETMHKNPKGFLTDPPRTESWANDGPSSPHVASGARGYGQVAVVSLPEIVQTPAYPCTATRWSLNAKAGLDPSWWTSTKRGLRLAIVAADRLISRGR